MRMRPLTAHKLRRRRSRHGLCNSSLEPLLVARNHRNGLAATRCGDVEQLLWHAVTGYDHRIDGFTLAAMGGDRVTVGEAAIAGGQRPAIVKLDSTGDVHGRHRNQFAVCGPQPRLAAVGGQQQSISERHLIGRASTTSKLATCLFEIVRSVPSAHRTTRLLDATRTISTVSFLAIDFTAL